MPSHDRAYIISSPGQGFSLIEVIVSIFFLMIAIAGLMATYNYMSLQVEKTRWKRSALHIAQRKIEEFMADPNKKFKPSEEEEIPVTAFCSVTSTVEIDKRSERITQNSAQSIKRVECKVTWKDREDVSVSLMTIVGN